MAVKVKNNATGELNAILAIGATSLEVKAGQGDRFDAVAAPDYFYGTLEDTSGNKEIVKVTARTISTNTMTIVRAQEGTIAREFPADSKFEVRLTAGVFQALLTESAASAASVAALGTMSTQAHTAVNIDGGAIDGVAIGHNATVSAKVDNETANVSIKARDHNLSTTPEITNVVVGTGSPPTASTVPLGTLWIKYVP